MGRLVRNRFQRSDLSSLRQRILPVGMAPAKVVFGSVPAEAD